MYAHRTTYHAQIGHRVLIDDGKIQVKVVEKGEGYVVTEVMNDAAISSRKGYV